MKYIFVINGREDKVGDINNFLDKELHGLKIDTQKYYTRGIGDGLRFVRIHCDLHPKDEECFVACGGSGTLNEVASGVAGYENKCIAAIPFGATNDFLKMFPEMDFRSIKKLVNGTEKLIDLIKLNDNYCINLVNSGFSAYVAMESVRFSGNKGLDAKAYRKGVVFSVLTKRRHKIKVTIDDEKINRHKILQCDICNGTVCGGQYLSAPNAVLDDGLMEVYVYKSKWLFGFIRLMNYYKKGTQQQTSYGRRKIVYRRAKKVILDSKDLIYLCVDGEILASRHYEMTILPQHIRFILPEKL